MRELHGVMYAGRPFLSLKHRALLFDKFQIWRYVNDGERNIEFETELDFLKDRGIVVPAPNLDANVFAEALLPNPDAGKRFSKQLDYATQAFNAKTEDEKFNATSTLFRDNGSRVLAGIIRDKSDYDAVAICELELPQALSDSSDRKAIGSVLTVMLDALPTPDNSCAWQDILDFKADMLDRQWALRRWLVSLARDSLSESEIRDEIEWSLSEYTKAMKIHHIKASQSSIDVFVVSPLEIIENLVKFNWSKIAKGALQVKKRKVELLEDELKAPGRECAYVFDARKRLALISKEINPVA